MAEQIPSEFLFEFLKVFGLSRKVQYVFFHREYMKMYACIWDEKFIMHTNFPSQISKIRF